ncbi:unnamed protein product [Effrenium voratum]|uniref:DRBM domain-containing protein n=1 Tax=Effrenium voratum TaxID=2562239 RepID=A0AA36NG79_9DINO|nr:unnamed protein product [Effrenium voratum]
MDPKAQILRFLREREDSWTETKEILDCLRQNPQISRKSDVNPHLYGLERESQIMKHPDSKKPSWKIAPAHAMSEGNPSGQRASQEGVAGVPVGTAPTENAKGELLALFGQHAAKFDVEPVGGQFLAKVSLGHLPPFTCTDVDKTAAQRMAEQEAMRFVNLHKDLHSHQHLIPQELRHDFKSQLQQKANTLPTYDTPQSEYGGFISTVTVGSTDIRSPCPGRRKADAEQLAAKLALETLTFGAAKAADSKTRGYANAASSMPGSSQLCRTDKELQMEALEEQMDEHEDLKRLLQDKGHPDFEQIRGNFSQCIKEAFKFGIIDEQQQRRLQGINGRGNCAKHNPEKLQPKVAGSRSLSPATGAGLGTSALEDMD